MTAADVLEVVGALRRAGVDAWLDGGWGIDALLGAEHRPHGDADLVVALEAIPDVCAALAGCSYRVAEDLLPTRMVLRTDEGRQVDLHPVTFDDAGNGRQVAAMPDGSDCEYPARGFTTGRIGGTAVGCLSAELQLAHHLGYRPRPHDVEDMGRLAERFGIDVPAAYGDSVS